MKPSLRHPGTRFDPPQHARHHQDQEADGAGDQPVTVLVEDPADHVLEREREHEPAIGIRPVGHRQARAGARHQAAGEDQHGGRSGDDERVEVEHHGRVRKQPQPANENATSLVSLAPTVTLCVMRAQRLVPRLHGVGAWRQALQGKRSVRLGDGVERMIQHAHVRVHPLVDVALERHHHLLGAERVRVAQALDGLADVELLVGHRQGVNVVQGGVAVQDLDRLAHLHAEDVRAVLTALLIQHDRRRGHRERQVAETVLHVDEHVLQRAVRAGDHPLGDGARVGAAGIRRHRDRLRRRRLAGERDAPGDGRGRGRIDRVGDRRRRAGRGALAPAAARDKTDGETQDQQRGRGVTG